MRFPGSVRPIEYTKLWLEGIGRKSRFIHPEQKGVGRTDELVIKFSYPVKLVVHALFSKFATAKKCLTAQWRRLFVDCEVDTDCFEVSTATQPETYATELEREVTHF